MDLVLGSLETQEKETDIYHSAGIRKTKEGYCLITVLSPFHQKIDLGLGSGEMELICCKDQGQQKGVEVRP